MNQAARRLGRSIALILPVSLVLSGTLAVTRVPWVASSAGSQLLTASTSTGGGSEHAARPAAAPPQQHRPLTAAGLKGSLLTTVREKDPGVALNDLNRAVLEHPSLAAHCTALAHSIGHAAVAKYGAAKARTFARPVCDASYLNATDGRS
ncbi:hypothetical protein BIV57_09340 [Mangrovactinospora gilvigrisea]|uniref:Uncharacterized protein n=1 Tax=Mangrovactinospora gilvigrisea TaxID=1428644 RepID=A0A1J7BGS1_9ACTN|nr:hypothetical protein [Mangrovactinospora gilvigrisea]OIV37765.1 hypothetical protein BIV57_09340 [Mangrovactinospora gilvigrisea]